MIVLNGRYYPTSGLYPKEEVYGPFPNKDAARSAMIDCANRIMCEMQPMKTEDRDYFTANIINEDRCAVTLHRGENFYIPIYDCWVEDIQIPLNGYDNSEEDGVYKESDDYPDE